MVPLTRRVVADWRRLWWAKQLPFLLAFTVLAGIGLGVASGAFEGLYWHGSLLPGADLADNAQTALSRLGYAQLVVMVLAVLNVTNEVRTGSVVSSLLAHPRRGGLSASKLASGVSLAILVGVVATASMTGAALVDAHRAHVTGQALLPCAMHDGADILLVCVAMSLMWTGIAFLVTKDVWAVSLVFGYVVVLSNLANSQVPSVGRWLPDGATQAMLRGGVTAPLAIDPLRSWEGALVLVAYGLAFALLGAWRFARMDVGTIGAD